MEPMNRGKRKGVTETEWISCTTLKPMLNHVNKGLTGTLLSLAGSVGLWKQTTRDLTLRTFL
jgi:hypothetical protein